MICLMTDNQTGETVALREQFNPWGKTRIWVEVDRVSHNDLQSLVELTIRGVTAEQMYQRIREESDG